MPTDSNGVYSLPSGYLATTGETIEASQHNPPLEDIATALTGRMPRSGVAPMTGPLKLVDGTVGAPAFAFNSALNTGIYKTTNGWGIAVGGVSVAEFTSNGLAGTIPLGGWCYYSGLVAPAGFIFGYGQTILRSLSPRFTTWVLNEIANGNTDYGVGDGSTTLVVPDYRDYVIAGKGDMGGTAANRLTGSTTLGGTQGSANHVLTKAELPTDQYTPAGSVALTLTAHLPAGPISGGQAPGSGLYAGGLTTSIVFDTKEASFNGTPFALGSGNGHSSVQPTKIQNVIIFVGA